MDNKVVHYFDGDTMAADVWRDKYQMKDNDKVPVEETPTDMHRRLAREFARVEYDYIVKELTNDGDKLNNLSNFGSKLYGKRASQRLQGVESIEEELFKYFDKFGQIVPQGSVMSNLGNHYNFGSLSNCFGIAPPYDSYGGIMRTDEHLAQLEKRRGGVGMSLDTIRPTNARVTNASRSSTGVPTYAERYSNTTREVAQNGRRGALMLLLMCNHPDVFRFVSMKDDRTKVTGANVTVKFTKNFMDALKEGRDFYCRFPIEAKVNLEGINLINYNQLLNWKDENGDIIQVMKIKPMELFDLVAEMAWKNAEPGVAFYDRVVDYSPEGVYDIYMPRVCNPCGEQWFAYLETCRLIALNFWSIVINHFEGSDAALDMDLLYELSYMQQRLGDDLVDLEVQYIDVILDKIRTDPEPLSVKQVEWQLWEGIRKVAQEGRRTGNGFTALGDMLAGLNMKYDSPEALATVEMVMKTKMRAELDCTIDMAILRGPFVGWDRDKEFDFHLETKGRNSFFQMLIKEFPQQAARMMQFGRRNTNWSTVAPTGTVSLMCQSTSGLEPLFKAYYIRRKKINPSEAGSRVDFTDQNGDTWQEYAVLHPKFKQWLDHHWGSPRLILVDFSKDSNENETVKIDYSLLSKETIQKAFEQSPWYGSEADDISWEKRIDMQAIIQKYTSNAISSTINLHKDTPQEVVKQIYLRAYDAGLKGVTVYRDGSRSGVLITEPSKAPTDVFGYTDAVKRPTELDAHYYPVHVQGKLFAVIVGVLDGMPYELFAFEGTLKDVELEGKLIKKKRRVYEFQAFNFKIQNVQLGSDRRDEKLLTRMCSQLLRHGVNPKHIVEQVEKSEVTVVSFAKAIVRVLKKYVPDEEVKGELCNECHQPTIIYEEGCKKCTSCGSSKC